MIAEERVLSFLYVSLYETIIYLAFILNINFSNSILAVFKENLLFKFLN